MSRRQSRSDHGSLPLVSVVVQCYNHADYVAGAVESVLRQGYSPTQVIVIDDGSTDGCARIVEELGRRHPDRLEVVLHETNRGLVRTFNEALTRVHGDALVRISGDDRLTDGAIEARVDWMRAHPDVDLLVTDVDVQDRSGRIYSGRAKDGVTPQFSRLHDVDFDDLYLSLLEGPFLPDIGVTVSFRRIRKEKLRYDPRCPDLSDYDLWLRLSRTCRWGFLDRATAVYGWHGENMSDPARLKAVDGILAQRIYILSKHLVSDQTPAQRRMTQATLGWCAVHLLSRYGALPLRLGAIAFQLSSPDKIGSSLRWQWRAWISRKSHAQRQSPTATKPPQ